MRRVGDHTVNANQHNATHEGRFDKATCNSTSPLCCLPRPSSVAIQVDIIRIGKCAGGCARCAADHRAGDRIAACDGRRTRTETRADPGARQGAITLAVAASA